MRRGDPVVGVQEQQVAATGDGQGGVACRAGAARLRAQETHARIARRMSARDRGCAVRRAVVDDDRLPVGHGLGVQAVECRVERRRRVARGDDDRDGGRRSGRRHHGSWSRVA